MTRKIRHPPAVSVASVFNGLISCKMAQPTQPPTKQMPLVKTTFTPAKGLGNTHLQTLYGAIIQKTTRINTRRERLTTPDHDFLDIDWYGENNQPLVILIHGLTGSSRSKYICSLQYTLSQQGLRSVAINLRGCSGVSNNTARCYHSGETEDIEFLYQTLRRREPDTAMAAVGFSLGGNIVLKWLGEQKKQVDLFAAVAVSVPLMLNECASKLDHGFSKLYRANLLYDLKGYMAAKLKHLDTIGQQGEADKIRRLGDLSGIASFWQYDDRVVAPLHGFKGVQDYYHRASSKQFLKSIARPTLIIQARDDPFMTEAVIPRADELSSSVYLEITEHGGHVGFIGGTPFKPVYWLNKRIPAFLLSQLTSQPTPANG